MEKLQLLHYYLNKGGGRGGGGGEGGGGRRRGRRRGIKELSRLDHMPSLILKKKGKKKERWEDKHWRQQVWLSGM